MAGEKSGQAGRVVLVLLIANVVLFGALLAWRNWADRERALPEFNADRIRLLEQPPTRTRATSQPDARAEPAVVPGPPALCYAVAGMTQARYQEFRDAMGKVGGAGIVYSVLSDNKAPWWVFWPPEYEAAKRTEVVKKLALAGVKDFVAIGKGAMAQAYSLGVFPNEPQARAQRDVLRQKGLEMAEYGIRPGIGAFKLRFVPDNTERAATLKGLLPSWAEVADCPS